MSDVAYRVFNSVDPKTRDPLDREMKPNSAVRGENDGAPLRRLVWERTRLARVVQKFCGPILIRNEVTERPAAPAVTKCPDFSGVPIGLTNQNAYLAAPLLGTSRRLAPRSQARRDASR